MSDNNGTPADAVSSERIGTKVRNMVEMIIRSQKSRLTDVGFKPLWNVFEQTSVWTHMSVCLTPEYQALYKELWDKTSAARN